MLSQCHSFVLQGIDAIACEVEVDVVADAMPKTTVVGKLGPIGRPVAFISESGVKKNRPSHDERQEEIAVLLVSGDGV